MAKITVEALAEKAARISKRLAEKGSGLPASQRRRARRSLKRAQRRRRSLIARARRVEATKTKRPKKEESAG